MASHPASRHQRRRQRRSNLANLSPSTLAVSAAVAAYGTYRLASWAWDAYWHEREPDGDDEQPQQSQEQQQQQESGAVRERAFVEKADDYERDSSDEPGHERAQQGSCRAQAARARDAVPPPRPQPRISHRRRRQARQIRIARCRTEIVQALADFLPTLKSTIETATDFTEETRELKRIRTARAARARALRSSAVEDERTAGIEQQGQDQQRERERERQGHRQREQREQQDNEEEEERRRERQLWNVVKVRSVSRLIATAYGHTILLLVLTVQVNLLGGRLFSEEMNEQEEGEGRERIDDQERQQRGQQGQRREEEIAVPGASEEEMAESATSSLGFASRTGPPGSNANLDSATSNRPFQSTHRTVLTRTYHHLFASGIASLVATVERAAEDALSEFDVTDADRMSITSREFGEVLEEVRDVVEERRGRRRVGRDSNRGGRNRRACLIKYVVQPDRDIGGAEEDMGGDNDAEAEEEAVDDPTAEHILEETWDILESPHFEAAERDCLDATFEMMRDGGWGGAFDRNDAVGPSSEEGEGEESSGSRPLAQVLTQLRRAANGFYGSGGGGATAATAANVNAYVPALVRLPSVVELGDVSFD